MADTSSPSEGLVLPEDYQDKHAAVSAWFLGPRAENFDLLQEFFANLLQEHRFRRAVLYDEDGDFISPGIKTTELFQQTVNKLRFVSSRLSWGLNLQSVPFFSPRYAGHMNTETSMPSLMGWLMTLLLNPNNVAFEASPFTTLLELDVGSALCKMLGFMREGNVVPWGHLTCDGTIANMEAMWAARNLKFYPFALREAMLDGGPLAFIADSFKVPLAGVSQLFKDLSPWQLLNLPMNISLDISDRLTAEYGITSEFLTTALSPYMVQSAGKEHILQKYGIDQPPLYLVPSTKHYSWPKSAALVGIGSAQCKSIAVDARARMDVSALNDMLEQCLNTRQAVYAVVVVVGSTEEGAVDPLDKIIALRDDYEARGLSFLVQADAAWGGYFATMVPPLGDRVGRSPRDFVPSIPMRAAVVKQFRMLAKTDSITIDPHKAGYIPYPAGGLCYRDGRMRFLLTWTAPYLDKGEAQSIGIYGIEGSKPGAPAVACHLHHKVVGLNLSGHGVLLGEASFTSRRMSALWASISDEKTSFIVVPFDPIIDNEDPNAEAARKRFIRDHIFDKNNEEIVKDREAFSVLCGLGSDLNINVFACNFRINGTVNTDVEEANYLNQRVYRLLSQVDQAPASDADTKPPPLFLSATTFQQAEYGQCAENFKRRLGLETDSGEDLFVLRNVVMSPFQAAGNFVKTTIGRIFRDVLEREVAHVIDRNTIRPQVHEFVMQGVQELYLAYRPHFHRADARHQIVLSAAFNDTDMWNKYQDYRRSNTSDILILRTTFKALLGDVLQPTPSLDFEICSTNKGSRFRLAGVRLSNVKVVKSRSLLSRWRDREYPSTYTPFYLYGSPDEQHIDHALLRAPNAQITSDCVALAIQPPLTAEHLRRGVWARVSIPERAMQPFSEATVSLVFRRERTLQVVLVEDRREPDAHGPNLDLDGQVLSRGTLVLRNAVFCDCKDVNETEFGTTAIGLSNFASAAPIAQTRATWAKFVETLRNEENEEIGNVGTAVS